MKYFTPRILVRTIIWTNVLLFLVALIFSGSSLGFTLNPLHALAPSFDVLIFLGGSGTIPIDKYDAWWSLLTANWLHGSLLHILFNMLALRTVAPLVINEFGMSRMFSIYTLTGAAGFYASYLGQVPLTIGASSGLCGLIGALLYYGKSRGGEWGHLVFKQTKAWIISLLLIGFLIPNINNWGHGGGLLAGIVLGWAMGYREKRKERLGDHILGTAMGLVTLALLIRTVLEGVRLIFF
ncbi:MAG: rhomboid family intramembrane serine protease [Desulfobacterales bacterium]|nr:rhomboid family intramembrane serine protease [Desulfobacterales bacterium]